VATSRSRPARGCTEGKKAVPKILVVDDDPTIRRVVATILSLDDFDVVEAEGGKDALRKLAQEHFDVVVLDIMMPEMSGYEVLERMAEIPSAAATPVIVLTAKEDTEGILREAESGAVDHVTKPFEPATLEEAVRRALRATGGDLEQRRQLLLRTAQVYSAMGKLRRDIE
jgi:CheY-like chemotaxis protein